MVVDVIEHSDVFPWLTSKGQGDAIGDVDALHSLSRQGNKLVLSSQVYNGFTGEKNKGCLR